MRYDALIIGGGVAGISCAVQMKILGMQCVVIEKDKPGGMVKHARMISNMPFAGEKSGRELCMHIEDSIAKHQIEVIKGKVSRIYCLDGVNTEIKGKKIEADFAVIATGTEPAVPSFSFAEHKSVSFYPPKENVENKSIAVIGGGDVAFDYALTASERGYIPVIYARSSIKANDTLKETAKERNIAVKKDEVKAINIVQEKPLIVFSSGECALYDKVLIAAGRTPVMPEIDGDTDNCILYAGDVRGENGMISRAYNDGIKCAMHIYRRKNNGK